MNCQIQTGMPYADVERLFRKELERTHPRSSVTLTEKNGKAVFTITAEDVSALRAALNGVTSILGIHEKTHELS